MWQPSFAALGFKNTPRAVLPGDVDFPKDYDSGDIRYASVSFAISRDYVFSVGPSVTEPRTGEILDADIGFSQEWVHAFSGSIGRDTVNALSGMSGASGHKNHRHQDHRRLRSRHNCNKERLAAFIENTGMSMRALADAADSSGRVPVEIIGRGLAGVTGVLSWSNCMNCMNCMNCKNGELLLFNFFFLFLTLSMMFLSS